MDVRALDAAYLAELIFYSGSNLIMDPPADRLVQLRSDVSHLTKLETLLDEHMRQTQSQLRRFTEESDQAKFASRSPSAVRPCSRACRFVYVTQDDLRSVAGADDSLLVIRAPAGTKLEVPDPDEGMEPGKRRFQIFLKGRDPDIELYLVPQQKAEEAAAQAPAAAAPHSPAAQQRASEAVVRLDQPEAEEAQDAGVADFFNDDPTSLFTV